MAGGTMIFSNSLDQYWDDFVKLEAAIEGSLICGKIGDAKEAMENLRLAYGMLCELKKDCQGIVKGLDEKIGLALSPQEQEAMTKEDLDQYWIAKGLL